ncbi:2-keto-4-pentenoate hydratase [Agromyces bauzanensis]
MVHIEDAAARLRSAAVSGRPCPPVRELEPFSVDDAYAIQELVVSPRVSARNPRVGRKVGLTSPAVQTQLGVDQPDFGVLLADMEIADGGEIPSGVLLQPRIEAEIAFVLATGIPDAHPETVARAVAYAVPALEIVDSRVEGWDITIVDTIADNASSGLFVLGAPRLGLDSFTPAAVSMTMRRNGELVSSGTGTDCLGDPLNALVWVAETALRLGRPLQEGEVVLSGALGPMVPVLPGDLFEAEISTLGPVSVRASAHSPASAGAPRRRVQTLRKDS